MQSLVIHNPQGGNVKLAEMLFRWPSALLVLLAMSSSPPAYACFVCTASLANLAFPFMPAGAIILGIWRIAYAYYQLKAMRGIERPLFLLTRGVCIIGCMVLFWWAGIFIYCAASLLKSFILLAWHRAKPVHNGVVRKIMLLNSTALLALMPFAFHGYYRKAQMSPVEKAEAFTGIGTGPERDLLMQVSRDPNFGIPEITRLIQSPDERKNSIGYMILYLRKRRDDLIALKDLVLKNRNLTASLRGDVKEMRDDTSNGYLWLWLGQLDIPSEVKTTESLHIWIETGKSPRSLNRTGRSGDTSGLP